MKITDCFKLFMPRRLAEDSALARQGEIDKVRNDLKLKLADKPGSVGLITKADSHSSRRTITCTLKQPTR